MRKIIINSPKYGRKEVLVDDDDYEELMKYHWCVAKMPKTFYAVRSTCKNGKEGSIKMHRQIMNETNPLVDIDHKNHNGLDNTKKNLRRCDSAGNKRNRKSAKGSSSKYVGVCWHKKDQKWQAAICIDGKQTHLGQFDKEKDAAIARDNAAKLHYGEFAFINIK